VSIFKNVWVKLKKLQFNLKKQKANNKIKKFYHHDQKLVQNLASNKKMPNLKQIRFSSKYFSKFERLILRILFGIILIACASFFINYYWINSQITPKAGGSYTEGLVGLPQYINPLYAQANDVDLDISSLIFSSLIKYTDQGLENELATEYQISEDQKEYTFKLRTDARWHDGEEFTADDVIFTFSRINNLKSKTPLYFNFKGSIVEKIDDYTVKFKLEEPFAPFLETLTIGILPEHIWNNITPENMILAEYNLKPIGTGPYKFKSLLKNKEGDIKSFNLEANEYFYKDNAYIQEISFKFFPSFELALTALNNKNVEGISYLPKELRPRIINNRNVNFNLLQLPQYTAIFFNHNNNPILKDKKIRKLLSHAINKEKIVNEILNAEAQAIDSPILPGSLGFSDDIVKYPYNVTHCKNELTKAGWTLADYVIKTEEPEEDTDDQEANSEEAETDSDSEISEQEVAIEEAVPIEEYAFQVRKLKERYLEFSLTTVDQPENIQIAKELQKEWQQIGAKINLIIVNSTEIQDIIKSRGYELLLYGQILGYDPDPYPFWHSSQNKFPGLNLTSLNDKTIDEILEYARKISNEQDRAQKYSDFQKLIAEEIPAIFLFNPTYTYPQSKKIKSFNTSKIITPSNRFNGVTNWYIKTKRTWQ